MAPDANPRLDFWFDPASSYSWLAAMGAEKRAAARGVGLRWRPFLLGPIFAAQGWTSSPFNLFPAKGAYMWRDVARLAARAGLSLKRPEPFPQNSLLAARVVLAAPDPERPAVARAILAAEYGEGLPIAGAENLAPILTRAGLDAAALLAAAATDEIKAALRAETDEARRLGVFGAPAFVCADGELFWGWDRFGEALDWALAPWPAGGGP